MGTKIQINSLPALLHLLEAEGGISVEIRRSVLKEYETKHVLPTIVKRIDEIVTDRVNDLLFKEKRWGDKTTLSDEYADVVKLAVRREAQGLVRGLVADAIEEAVTPEALEHRVTTLVQDLSFYEVQKQVKAKIAEALG